MKTKKFFSNQHGSQKVNFVNSQEGNKYAPHVTYQSLENNKNDNLKRT